MDMLFRISALGQITGHLRETANSALTIAKDGDDRIRPETRSILSEAPTFVFHATFLSRRRQLCFRLSGGAILGSIKDLEVSPHGLIGRVPHGSYGAAVP